MARETRKAGPAETGPAGTVADEAAARAEETVVQLNEEAFDGIVEMQMSFFEAANRYAQEVSEFAARRARANIEDFSSLAGAKSPPELLQAQFGYMRTMFEDYSAEASRLMTLTRDIMMESGRAVRSSYPDELKKAG
ncbi:phasin family protein [Microbaculum marinum]|uniref:Phasin family protein n=1 Tax=Microbaculum marinum TaxID=1764581 RepID=A0AAW9S1H5_9HYPH